MKKMDAGITVDSEIIEQVSTEFLTQLWSPIASSSWSIWGQLTTSAVRRTAPRHHMPSILRSLPCLQAVMPPLPTI